MTEISPGSIAAMAIFGLCAVLLLLFGYLIRERGKLNLLAGYDPRQVADPPGLARFAGKILYQMAAATLLVPIAGEVLGNVLSDGIAARAITAAGYGAFVLFMCVRLVVGARRYMK